ncbi:hypothetical protein NQZ68_033309 [Dissostichus eleginoides]|nr:hypothetical protein NQZ68_033309 [Dissostichus eleginoides]
MNLYSPTECTVQTVSQAFPISEIQSKHLNDQVLRESFRENLRRGISTVIPEICEECQLSDGELLDHFLRRWRLPFCWTACDWRMLSESGLAALRLTSSSRGMTALWCSLWISCLLPLCVTPARLPTAQPTGYKDGCKAHIQQFLCLVGISGLSLSPPSPRGPMASRGVPHVHRWTSSGDKMMSFTGRWHNFPSAATALGKVVTEVPHNVV